MTLTIICVEKTGSIKEIELKTFVEQDLYKKAGLKSSKDFELQAEWGADVNGKSYSVSVFGKITGRAGQENKYDFPPPIDNTLFFGSCLLVNKVNGKPSNLSKVEWKVIYEHLFGGFEDLGEEDSELSEDDVSDSVPRTKEGYVKDGFIVDDDEEEEEEDFEDIEDEEEEAVSSVSEEDVIIEKNKKVRRFRTTKLATVKPPSKKKVDKQRNQNIFTKISTEINNYLDCTSELSEEEYVYTVEDFNSHRG